MKDAEEKGPVYSLSTLRRLDKFETKIDDLVKTCHQIQSDVRSLNEHFVRTEQELYEVKEATIENTRWIDKNRRAMYIIGLVITAATIAAFLGVSPAEVV